MKHIHMKGMVFLSYYYSAFYPYDDDDDDFLLLRVCYMRRVCMKIFPEINP